MARDIFKFKGDTCVVGRTWAGPRPTRRQTAVQYEEARHKADDDLADLYPWWLHSKSDISFNPKEAYYIDIQTNCAADMVCDFSKVLKEGILPDEKFKLVILECLPIFCYDSGKQTIVNAARILKTGGNLNIFGNIEKTRVLNLLSLNPAMRLLTVHKTGRPKVRTIDVTTEHPAVRSSRVARAYGVSVGQRVTEKEQLSFIEAKKG